jgi:hypothetical protein
MYAKEQLRLPVPHAAGPAVHAQLEPGLPGLREGQGLAAANDPMQLRCTRTRCRASASRRRAKARAASRPTHCANASRPTSTRCRSGTRRWRVRRQREIPAGGDHAAADGDVPLVGFAERLAAPDPQPQLPVREPATAQEAGIEDGGWVGDERLGPGAAWCATATRWSPARCGPGTPSARLPAPGSWRPAPTSRARASCSIT